MFLNYARALFPIAVGLNVKINIVRTEQRYLKEYN